MKYKVGRYLHNIIHHLRHVEKVKGKKIQKRERRQQKCGGRQIMKQENKLNEKGGGICNTMDIENANHIL